MRERKLQLELDGDSATLCIHGLLDHAGDSSMLDLCAELPLHVRTLRVDLRPLGALSGEATGAVRSLLAYWRTTRGGEFRLITSHLLATCTPAATAAVSRPVPPAAHLRGEAMSAALH